MMNSILRKKLRDLEEYQAIGFFIVHLLSWVSLSCGQLESAALVNVDFKLIKPPTIL